MILILSTGIIMKIEIIPTSLLYNPDLLIQLGGKYKTKTDNQIKVKDLGFIY